jgi:hypothetical protein
LILGFHFDCHDREPTQAGALPAQVKISNAPPFQVTLTR